MIDLGIPRTLKTLSLRDADFKAHLDGTFSLSEIALPVRSLNVDTQKEEVTFAISKFDDVSRPSLFAISRALVRPSSLIFSAGPMAAVLARLVSVGYPVNWLLALGCFVGILAFHIATNLFNDYGDHMTGQDRVRPKGGSRAIQNGWVRAYRVRQAAWSLTVFAALCGLPAILRSPVLLVSGIALFVALEFAFQKLRLKRRGFSEVLAFGLTGPLLTAGFAWALTSSFTLADLFLGAIFGAMSLLYFHSANFENIMVDSQAGARTWATRTGFEASQRFYLFVSFVCLSLTALHVFAVERNLKLLPVLVVQVFVLIPVGLRVMKLASPLSSELVGLRFEAVRLSWLTTIALIGSFVWMNQV